MVRTIFFLLALAKVILAADPKYIIHILADDLGWSELGYHRPLDTSKDVQTPNIDQLISESIELDRFYVHAICSPSRSAIQSGRAPIHVNVQNVLPESYNLKDDEGGYQGIPKDMTGIAEKLRDAGFDTHIVGKWDVGMARPELGPKYRGYDTWTGYWHHSNDYWNHKADDSTCNVFQKLPDLWTWNSTFNGPRPDLANGPNCNQDNQSPAGETCVYEEALFTERVKDIINTHDKEESLFLFWSMHLVHMPLQVPQEFLDKFSFIDNQYRRLMHAMTNYMDNDIGEVVDLLKSNGMWNNTLFVFHADNGGEILDEICGGNNWPLRGGKFSNWEGGIRVNAFVSGGLIPPSRRGVKDSGYITGWDWYSTYASIAGVDPTDKKAEKAGLPPIDSINMWPFLSGQTSSPRNEIIIGDTSALLPNGDGQTRVGGIIQGDYKMLLGAPDKLYIIQQYTHTGPKWPNSTSHMIPLLMGKTCGRSPSKGCLYNIKVDPYENYNLAETNTTLFNSMLARIDELQKTVYSPDRGSVQNTACQVAKSKYGGYWGPFLDLP